ncbi:MAG: hypothetical protein JXB46_04945 [Candidatus Eisenbacteria bacterium]|nr:hypothetical protein [Candidatus Eisenbacteria bacterium]
MTAIAFIGASAPVSAQLALDVESGAVFSGYNDVQIPGDAGTRFSLKDDLDPDVGAFVRVRLEYTIGERHTVAALYAPLTIQATGRSDAAIDFAGETFPAGTDLTGDYTFNSYRLTYRYEFTPRGRLSYGLGFTAKMRDAAIRVEGGGLESEKTNVGFVPLLNFRLNYALSDKVTGILEGDALAASQGRAEDVFLGMRYQLTDLIGLKAGYRMVEGGADNDKVYNFAMINYAVLGLTLSF